MVCDKTLPCGHPCSGVKGEENCLACLHGCATDNPKLKQDADDMCMVCYTEGLSCAACIQVCACMCTIFTQSLAAATNNLNLLRGRGTTNRKQPTI